MWLQDVTTSKVGAGLIIFARRICFFRLFILNLQHKTENDSIKLMKRLYSLIMFLALLSI